MATLTPPAINVEVHRRVSDRMMRMTLEVGEDVIRAQMPYVRKGYVLEAHLTEKKEDWYDTTIYRMGPPESLSALLMRTAILASIIENGGSLENSFAVESESPPPRTRNGRR